MQQIITKNKFQLSIQYTWIFSRFIPVSGLIEPFFNFQETLVPGSGNIISKGQILQEFSKWGPNFRIEFDITVKKSVEICTAKVSESFQYIWTKSSFDDAKSNCANGDKELTYFEDKASFDKFVKEIAYDKETWVGAKIVTIDGSRKYQVVLVFQSL